MALVSSEEVDCLETVHPLDYPVFQSLICNQFAHRRRLPTHTRSSPVPGIRSSSAEDNVFFMGVNPLRLFDMPNKDNTNDTEENLCQTRPGGCNTFMEIQDNMVMNFGTSGKTNITSTASSPQPGTSSQQTSVSSDMPRRPDSIFTPERRKIHKNGATLNAMHGKEKTVSFAGFRRAMNPHRAVMGSLHQASLNRGLSEYRGSQSLTIGLAAIMTSKSLPVHMWIPSDLDSIVRSGDRLHENVMLSLQRSPGESQLTLEEIQPSKSFPFVIPAPLPDVPNWSENNSIQLKMSLRRSETYHGDLRRRGSHSKPSDHTEMTLEEALCQIFDNGFDGALVNVGESEGTVIRDLRGRVRYFDSHSNNKYGREKRNGAAVLLRFPTARCFVHHMKRKEKKTGNRYKAVGVAFRVKERVALER